MDVKQVHKEVMSGQRAMLSTENSVVHERNSVTEAPDDHVGSLMVEPACSVHSEDLYLDTQHG